MLEEDDEPDDDPDESESDVAFWAKMVVGTVAVSPKASITTSGHRECGTGRRIILRRRGRRRSVGPAEGGFCASSVVVVMVGKKSKPKQVVVALAGWTLWRKK